MYGRDHVVPPAPLLLVAGVALVLLWHLLPAHTLPLYDGLGTPPERYRLLGGAGTPLSARMSLPPGAVERLGADVYTGEQPPQARLVVHAGSVRPPSGARLLVLSIRAVPPPPLPAGWITDGNAYLLVVAVPNGRAVSLKPGKTVTVELRSPTALGTPVLAWYHEGRWNHLDTGQFLSSTVYFAHARGFGTFALLIRGHAHNVSPAPTARPYLLIGALVTALCAVGLLLVRLARRIGGGS